MESDSEPKLEKIQIVELSTYTILSQVYTSITFDLYKIKDQNIEYLLKVIHNHDASHEISILHVLKDKLVLKCRKYGIMKGQFSIMKKTYQGELIFLLLFDYISLTYPLRILKRKFNMSKNQKLRDLFLFLLNNKIYVQNLDDAVFFDNIGNPLIIDYSQSYLIGHQLLGTPEIEDKIELKFYYSNFN